MKQICWGEEDELRWAWIRKFVGMEWNWEGRGECLAWRVIVGLMVMMMSTW